MNLTDAQKQQVSAWIQEGQKVSEIQKRLENELGMKMTYMEVRFLLDDLKVIPKDPAVIAPTPPLGGGPANATPSTAAPEPMGQTGAPADGGEAMPGSGHVKLAVDHITKPGSLVSGSVTFSDGQSGAWYLDEMGRLGLAMKQKGYRPSPADVEEFQIKLQQELARQGL